MTTRSTQNDPRAGDLTPRLLGAPFWSDHLLAEAGIPVTDVRLVTVGGGVGSFVLAGRLRSRGVAAGDLRVLSNLDVPWQTFEHLSRVSQWPGPERGKLLQELRREHDRIAYPELLAKGTVRMVRRRQGGGYFTVLTPPAGTTPTKRVIYRSQFVHLAVGHPGLKILPDLQRYRADTGDHHRVVNACEGHEHVYRELAARPCTVLVRGTDEVADRILQKLVDDRHEHRTNVRIVQVSARVRSRSLRRQLERASREGWYQAVGGEAQLLRATQERLTVLLSTRPITGLVPGLAAGPATGGNQLEIACDFVIDCTGMETDVAEHRVIGDLLTHGGARRTPQNRLAVESTFEVSGTRNGVGRLYASGAAALPDTSSDTFAGLRTAAQEISRDLARQGYGKPPGPMRATQQWWRRTRGRTPS